jgi:hypothetical protein
MANHTKPSGYALATVENPFLSMYGEPFTRVRTPLHYLFLITSRLTGIRTEPLSIMDDLVTKSPDGILPIH